MYATKWGFIALTLGFVLCAAASLRAEDMPAPAPAPAPKTDAPAKLDFSKFANPNPGKCLVSDEELDSDKVTADYKGKTYVFCCNGCKKKFVANPEKFIPAEKK